MNNKEAVVPTPVDQEAERREALAASFKPIDPPTCVASFELAQGELLRGLELVMKSVLRSVRISRQLPILAHVLVQAESDHVTLSGTNLDTGIELVVGAQVKRTGTFTVNARRLFDCVKTFAKAGLVAIEVSDGQVNVSCGKRTFTLKETMDASDFPCLPVVQTACPCVIAANDLRQGIREVQFAAATDDSRPVFLAICMHIQGAEMNLVALDGMRMAIRTLAHSSGMGWDETVLVPAHSWQLLCDVMPRDEEVTIAWDKDRAAFTCDNIRLVTRLIGGTYPVYQNALPSSYKTTFTLLRSDLVSLLSAFKPFTRDSSNMLKLFYHVGEVTFQAESDDLGVVQDTLETVVEGEDGHAILNAQYVADVLEAVKEASFTFSVSGYGHPCLMTPVGRDDYQALVMPMSCDR